MRIPERTPRAPQRIDHTGEQTAQRDLLKSDGQAQSCKEKEQRALPDRLLPTLCPVFRLISHNVYICTLAHRLRGYPNIGFEVSC